MKKVLYTLFFFCSVLAISMAQRTVEGRIMDEESNDPLIGANVIAEGQNTGTVTGTDGSFKLLVPEGTEYLLIQYIGYKTARIPLAEWTNGDIKLFSDALGLDEIVVVGRGVIDLEEDRVTPIAVTTILNTEIQQKYVGNVEFPEVMKNVPSVYTSNQVGFGDSQMFLRGFDQTNTAFLLNGQPINGMEDGRMYWSNWSGMTDIANAVQVQRGLGSSKLAISSVGGTVNIVTKATEKHKGGFVRLMAGNNGYMKGTIAYNTGLSKKGWGVSIMLDHWQAYNKGNEKVGKYDLGTAGQGQNYFLSVGKLVGDHNFNFLIFGAPQWHMQKYSQSVEVLENFRKYNQHWGFDQGDLESERTNFYHKPVMNFNWDWNISDRSNLSTVVYASFGRGGGTGPLGNGIVREDDYQNVNGTELSLDGQIDFDAIRTRNAQIGTGGDYSAPMGAGYIRRGSMNNHQWYGMVTNYGTELSDNLSLNVGADFRFYTGDHFRQVIDMYGLTGWIRDLDGRVTTEEYSINPWATLFNFADEEDRIGYDYSENINYQGVFGQLEYAANSFSVFFQGALSNQSYQRENRWVTGNPVESDKVSKIGYNLKGGASYAINANHKIFANAGFYSRQPYLDNIFSGTTDLAEPEVDNEEITGLEAGYRFNMDNFSLNLNVYSTKWANRFVSNGNSIVEIATGEEIDLAREQTDVTQLHSGVEIETQYLVSNKIRIGAYGSFGSWKFSGSTPYQSRDYRSDGYFTNADLALYTDRDGNPLPANFFTGEVDLDGVKIGNAPQLSFGLNALYHITPNFNVGLNWNIYDNLYEFVDVSDVVAQGSSYKVTKLDGYNVFDLTAGYTFDLGKNALELKGNVYNLLNSTFINQSDAFGYFYGNGTTYNVSLAYRF